MGAVGYNGVEKLWRRNHSAGLSRFTGGGGSHSSSRRSTVSGRTFPLGWSAVAPRRREPDSSLGNATRPIERLGRRAGLGVSEVGARALQALVQMVAGAAFVATPALRARGRLTGAAPLIREIGRAHV